MQCQSSTLSDTEEVSRRLLTSAARLSRNAMTEIDWNAPMDPAHYGCSPEWSTLYGTAYWDEMTEQQRVTLTLSVDHRVTSGRYAADFLAALVREFESV